MNDAAHFRQPQISLMAFRERRLMRSVYGCVHAHIQNFDR